MTLDKLKFYIVTPQAATNMILNPTPYKSLYVYNAVVGSINLTSDYSRRGPGCVKVTPTTSASGVRCYGGLLSSGTTYTFSVDVKGEAGKAMRIYFATSGGSALTTTTFTATGEWQRISVTRTETSSDTREMYIVRDATTGTNNFYVDGLQLEIGSEPTTFFTGDTQGFGVAPQEFYWGGTPHASVSYRTANTRAGGALLDIDDYTTVITAYGLGMGVYKQVYTELVSGGALYQKHIRKPRNFSLLMTYAGDGPDELHASRNTIIEACRPDVTGYPQPMVVRYQGIDSSGFDATQPVDIVCVPQTSHEDTPDAPMYQKDTLSFTVLDGLLHGAYQEGTELDIYDSISNTNYIVMQTAAGQWQAVGGGLNGAVYALAVGPDGTLYAGGNFLNAGGDGAADYIAKWNGSTWSSVGGGLNGLVRALCFAPNGDLYVGGDFTNAGSDADADYIAKWNGTAWSNVFGGVNGAVHAIYIDSGYVHIGGAFTNAGGDADADYYAYGATAWGALFGGLNGIVRAIYVGHEYSQTGSYVIIGGDFASVGSDSAKSYALIGRESGSSWEAMAGGLDGAVRTIQALTGGGFYIGGDFDNAVGGATLNHFAYWSGANWFGAPIGGLDNNVHIITRVLGRTFVGGAFTGTFTTQSPVNLEASAYYDGSWKKTGVAFTTPTTVQAADDGLDGALYVGYTTSTSAIGAGVVTIDNGGNSLAYPTIRIHGPGDLSQIVNLTTGKQISFSGMALSSGEILTLVLDPANLSVTSDFQGNVLSRIEAGSDIGDFYLRSGDNDIALYMYDNTDADSTAYITWKPKFWNIEGAKL